jgi:ubiquinone/menaquinone biosynthesis C-methylase UbiE
MPVNKVIYDSIGNGYNTTRCADPYLSERLFQLLKPEPGKKYLDIGCGTGNYTIDLANRNISLWGMDPSAKMLSEAKAKSNRINWIYGFAEDIPFTDGFFDGAIATLTIHHWTNLESSFKEICRILKPESPLLIFTSTPQQMEGYWLNHYFPKIMKKADYKMPSLSKVESSLRDAGFELTLTENYFIRDDLKDLFLYSCKNKPELCFDENIRKGISTFALSENQEEIELGLLNLKNDLEQNHWEQIKNKFENSHGDYLFILAKKGNS